MKLFPAHGISVYRDHGKTVYHDPGNSAYRFHHRIMEPPPQKGLFPLLIALDLVHIDELVLKRAFLELIELRDGIFGHFGLPFGESISYLQHFI